jgi:hypothetical protein
MTSALKLYIDSEPASLAPAPMLKNGDVLVPLHAFSKAVEAEVKALESTGKFAVCKGDLCIPIDDNANIVSIEDIVYVPLSAFADVLGLSWKIENNILLVTSSAAEHTGLGIGDHPPDFTLPDSYTGELVSLKDYRGKKAVFFMWASW